MNQTLVKYRTEGKTHNEYAVVPTLWLLDLLDWLRFEAGAEIIETTHNMVDTFDAPTNWPCYQTCKEYVTFSDLMASVR
jgi:hypothetical protein